MVSKSPERSATAIAAYAENKGKAARRLKKRICRAGPEKASQMILQYARKHGDENATKMLRLIKEMIVMHRIYGKLESRSCRNLAYASAEYLHAERKYCLDVLFRIYKLIDTGSVFEMIKRDGASKLFGQALSRVVAARILHSGVEHSAPLLRWLSRCRKVQQGLLLCRCIREFVRLARKTAQQHADFFASILEPLLDDRATSTEACAALCSLKRISGSETTFCKLERIFNDTKNGAALRAIMALGPEFSARAFTLLRAQPVSMAHILALDSLVLEPLPTDYFKSCLPGIAKLLDSATSRKMKRALVSLALKMPSKMLFESFKDNPGILCSIYTALGKALKKDQLANQNGCNNTAFRDGKTSTDENAAGCLQPDAASIGHRYVPETTEYFDFIRHSIQKDEKKAIAKLKFLIMHLKTSQISLIVRECVSGVRMSKQIGYYRALLQLIEYVENKKLLALLYIERLEIAIQEEEHAYGNGRLGGVEIMILIVKTLSVVYKCIKFREEAELLVILAKLLGAASTELLRAALAFVLQLEGAFASTASNESARMVHSSLALLQSTDRRVSGGAILLLKRLSTRLGVGNILGLVRLDEKNRTHRGNICRLFCALSAGSMHIVLPVLLVDYSGQCPLARHSVLRIIARMKDMEHMNIIVPVLESSLTSHRPQTRALGLKAAANIVHQAESIEVVHHILNLSWYFVVDEALIHEFNTCFSAIAKRCGGKPLLRYFARGLLHPCARIRNRYTEVFELAKEADPEMSLEFITQLRDGVHFA